MERHFHEELKELKQKLLKMGFLVESAVDKAIDSFLARKTWMAEEVIEEEKQINQLEIDIDEEGHKLCALWQPLAVDLRLVTSILKMSKDFERMGDHAVNIAECAIKIAGQSPFADLEFPKMSIAVLSILSDALKSFMDENAELARQVLAQDDQIDQFNDNARNRITQLMEKNPSVIKTGINYLIVAHNLERIGDLASNIAEDVVYLKSGKEVRHRIEERQVKLID